MFTKESNWLKQGKQIKDNKNQRKSKQKMQPLKHHHSSQQSLMTIMTIENIHTSILYIKSTSFKYIKKLLCKSSYTGFYFEYEMYLDTKDLYSIKMANC